MNFTSGSKPSLEELKRRNMPPEIPTVQGESLPIQTEAMPASQETHPTEEEWLELLETLSAMYRLISDWIRSRDSRPMDLPQRELAQTAKDVAVIRLLMEQEHQRREQAGKKNGRHFSFRWPSLSLPHPSPAWLFLPMILAALWALWHSLGMLWSAISPLLS